MRNIKILLEYDGTNYHGWQMQKRITHPTIQDALERAISAIDKGTACLHGSGRTDAGVHALGQVANFLTTSSMPPEAWAPALNHVLPDDIRILSSSEVSSDFHARHSALRKTYQYRILRRTEPSALYRNHAWHIANRLRLNRMKQSLLHLVGTHDFSSFRASQCSAKSPVRTIESASIKKCGQFIDIRLEANGFLQHMVRNIVGTLVESGLGRFTPDEVKRILHGKNRSLAGKIAPPHGLYLIKVEYPV